jgi:hypothetical protein
MDFLKKQYAPSIAMIHRHLGVRRFKSYLSGLLEDGAERLSARHERMLRQALERKRVKQTLSSSLIVEGGEHEQ